MILQRAAPSFSKPLVSLPILIVVVVTAMALPHPLVRALPASGAAKSLADGDVVTTTKLAQNLPGGRLYDKVYRRPTANAQAWPRVTGVTQPQATFSEVFGAVSSTSDGPKRQIGMFVLLLITLSAVTLLTWRHYRRDYASPRRIGRRI